MSLFESESTVGVYRLTMPIASNRGALYLATHLLLEKPAFLHKIPCHDCPPEGIARFIDRISILGRINHPNILKIHDCFRHGADLILVTEYVDAPKLSNLLQRG